MATAAEAGKAVGRGVSLGPEDRKAYDLVASRYPEKAGFSVVIRDLIHKAAIRTVPTIGDVVRDSLPADVAATFDALRLAISPGTSNEVFAEIVRREAKRSLCSCGGAFVKDESRPKKDRRHLCNRCGKSVAR